MLVMSSNPNGPELLGCWSISTYSSVIRIAISVGLNLYRNISICYLLGWATLLVTVNADSLISTTFLGLVSPPKASNEGLFLCGTYRKQYDITCLDALR